VLILASASHRCDVTFEGSGAAPSESIDVTEGWKGAQNSLLTVLGLVGVQGVSDAFLLKRAAHGT